MAYYGYIYQIIIKDLNSNLNDHYYIGQHASSVIDLDYWGSGIDIRNYIQTNGTQCLDRIVLEWASSAEELNSLESIWIADKWCNDPLCLNRAPGGNVPTSCNDEEYRKYLSKKNSDLKWYNNGITCVFTHNQPEGFVPGRINVTYTKQSSEVMSKKGKGRKYYTNGVINIKIFGDPPEGFTEELTFAKANDQKNLKYYHKGILQIRALQPPDETWQEGKLYKKIPDDWKYYNNGSFIVRAPCCPEGFKLGKIPKNHTKK